MLGCFTKKASFCKRSPYGQRHIHMKFTFQLNLKVLYEPSKVKDHNSRKWLNCVFISAHIYSKVTK